MAKASEIPAWQQALLTMSAAVTGVVVIGVLYWAQVVFIPLALGIFLTFLLNPVIRVLERRGLGRAPSVVLVVVLAGLLLSGLVWLVTGHVASLTAELPTYTENIKGKVRQLRQLGGRSKLSERFTKMQQEISEELDSPKAEVSPGDAVGNAAPEIEPAVLSRQGPSELTETPAWLAGVLAVMLPALGSLGAVALAVLLAIFMLLNREDLRNRFIRMIGTGRMAGMTKAVDDAGERISRYLQMQLIVNGTYGLAWGAGLYLIGVDYALLWGFLAVILRYVPYVGAPIASILPIALSILQFPGWWQPLAVIGLLIVLELLSNNIMEPWLYGMSIGVSVVATVVAAVFWGFLWGPIGLVLSSPLTVCLIVLGKYVPQLEFFHILLGDEPVLDPHVTFYQRLLARDQDEAAQLVLTYARTSPVDEVYDALLIPALNYARRDRQRDELTEADEEFIHRATQEVLEDLGEQCRAEKPEDAALEQSATNEVGAEAPKRVHIMACPAQDEADRLGLAMLQKLLDDGKWEFEITPESMLTSELVALVAEKRPALICIGSLPPGGLAHTRYLCKRLRAPFPGVKIVVGRWGLKANVDSHREQLEEAGADLMATTLIETRDQIEGWLPALQNPAGRAAG